VDIDKSLTVIKKTTPLLAKTDVTLDDIVIEKEKKQVNFPPEIVIVDAIYEAPNNNIERPSREINTLERVVMPEIREDVNRASDYIMDGKKHHFARNYDAALKSYGYALEIDKHSTDALSGKAKTLISIGKKKEALKCYDTILEEHPSSLLARINRGNTLLLMNKYVDAAKAFMGVIERDTSNIHAWNGRTEATWKLGRKMWRKKNKTKYLKHARDYAEYAIELEPMSEKAWFLLGSICHDQGYETEARSCYAARKKLIDFQAKRLCLISQ